jgi:hypothetical protein
MMRWREKLGLICLVGLALINCIRVLQSDKPVTWLQKVQKTNKIPTDPITRLEAQLQCLRAVLRPDQEIGYLSSLEAGPGAEYRLWFQYSLAPTLVADTPAGEPVGAYIPDRAALPSIQTKGLEVSLDCGNGIYLLKRNNLR